MRKLSAVLWIAILLALPLPLLADAPTWGLASQYDPGVMPGVVARRVRWGQLEERGTLRTVYLAGPDCTAIGERLWIRPQNWATGLYAARQGWEQAIIADCPGDWQAANFLAGLGVPYEVDGETVARWGYPRGRGVPVEVSARRPWAMTLEGVR